MEDNVRLMTPSQIESAVACVSAVILNTVVKQKKGHVRSSTTNMYIFS